VRYFTSEGFFKIFYFFFKGHGINEWEDVGTLKIPKSSYESPVV